MDPVFLAREVLLMNVDIKKITNLMCKQGMNQRQLAEGAGVSKNTVSSIMRGGSAKVVTIGKLSRYLDCKPGELLRM